MCNVHKSSINVSRKYVYILFILFNINEYCFVKFPGQNRNKCQKLVKQIFCSFSGQLRVCTYRDRVLGEEQSWVNMEGEGSAMRRRSRDGEEEGAGRAGSRAGEWSKPSGSMSTTGRALQLPIRFLKDIYHIIQSGQNIPRL